MNLYWRYHISLLWTPEPKQLRSKTNSRTSFQTNQHPDNHAIDAVSKPARQPASFATAKTGAEVQVVCLLTSHDIPDYPLGNSHCVYRSDKSQGLLPDSSLACGSFKLVGRSCNPSGQRSQTTMVLWVLASLRPAP